MKTVRSRLIALTVAGAVGAALPAAAGAQPPPPDYYPAYPWLWQGWYAGLHLGWGEAGPADGFVGGVQAGYNWQKGQLVYGFEADVTWSDISFSDGVRFCDFDGCVSARASASIDWMATVRGRLGYLFQPSLMAYATAGFGFLSASASASVSGFGVRDRISFSDTDTDFVFGIGVEGKLSEVSALRVEYLGFSDSEIDIIRAALSFKLGN
jgi:outer membrane immunogenic protein